MTSPHADSGRAPLTRDSGMPLYQQIHQLLRLRITTGEYRPGMKIPSESELRRELAVSRVTVREALRELVHDGLLVKVHGKGTFVGQTQSRIATVKYTGFLEDLQHRVRKLKVTEVDQTTVTGPPAVTATLGVPAGTQVVRIKRVRHVDDEPFSFTVNFLPLAIGSRIRTEDLYTVPLLKVLQRDLRIPIVRAHETIDALPADPEVARKLGIPVLYPVLHVRRLMYAADEHPFEIVETFYRADKYHYGVNLVRTKRNGKWTWLTEVETAANTP